MHRLRDMLAYAALWLAIEAARMAVRILPRRFLLSLSTAFSDTAFYLFSGFHKRSTGNLRRAFGDRFDAKKSRSLVKESLRNFFRSFFEMGLAFEQTPEQMRAQIPVEGREHLAEALDKNAGVIALSGHLGNFFLLGTRLAVEGYSTHVLIKQPKTGTLAQIFDHYRLQIGQKTIHARPRRQAFRELIQVLRLNEVAVVIADEFRSGSGIYVPFFGCTVLARRGPATLALRTGAALVPVYLIRNPNGELSLIIEPEIKLSKTGDIKADVTESTRRITQWLEKTVRQYPDQWNWMNIHWHQAYGLEKNHPCETVSGEKSSQQGGTKQK
ncbi:MAG: lysophospholipid acyltransferase family protein [Candidatus Binatia bacterium]